MTKRDYEAAARIAQTYGPQGPAKEPDCDASVGYENVIDAFVTLFKVDNPRFDEARFRHACVPGANVKARG